MVSVTTAGSITRSPGSEPVAHSWSLTTVHPYKGTVVLLFESDYKVKASLVHTNSLATFLVSSIQSGLLGGKTDS